MSVTNIRPEVPPEDNNSRSKADITPPEGEEPSSMFRSPLVVICGFLALCAMLATYIVLELNGRSTTNFLTFIVGIAAIVPGTAAYNAVRSVKRDSMEIKKQTNGPLTRTHETVISVDDRLSTLEDSIQRIADRLPKSLP